MRAEHAQDVVAAGSGPPGRDPVGAEPVLAARPSPQDHGALRDPVRAEPLEVVDPAVERLAVAGGVPSELRIPDRSVRYGVTRYAVQQPTVASATLDPASRPGGPVVPAA